MKTQLPETRGERGRLIYAHSFQRLESPQFRSINSCPSAAGLRALILKFSPGA